MNSSETPGPIQARPPSAKLVLSVAEAASALGVSDDLLYELTERGEFPFLRIGRRKVIPLRAIEALLDESVAGGLDPDAIESTRPGQTGNAATGDFVV